MVIVRILLFIGLESKDATLLIKPTRVQDPVLGVDFMSQFTGHGVRGPDGDSGSHCRNGSAGSFEGL